MTADRRLERTTTMQKITPCLWFDTEGEEAAKFYTSVFKNSRILDVTYYGEAGPRPAGTVLAVKFELHGPQVGAVKRRPPVRCHQGIPVPGGCGPPGAGGG